MLSNQNKDYRSRNFATLVYPESAPDGWTDILQNMAVPCFVSPLHDSDIDNETGEVKKAHYHVLLKFEGKKSLDNVSSLVAKFGGVGCKVVQSARGYARYLCHLDNPEKAQYSPEDVQAFAGADYYAEIENPTDKYQAIREMIQFCADNKIVVYADLLDYASVHREDWFRVLCDSGTYVMKEYLKSRTWSMK